MEQITSPAPRLSAAPAVTSRPHAAGTARDGDGDPALRRAAVEFETMFLARMLEETGLGKPPETFGGGAGEAAFSGLLVREQAGLMAERGGIGLAERLFEALADRTGAP